MALSRLLPRLQPRPEPVSEPVEDEPVDPVDEPPRLQAVPAPAPRSPRRPRPEGALMAQVIALANQKGGVAKTTTTLNLGVALREQGRRVLIIDLDPQGNLTMSQGMTPSDRALDVRRARPPRPDLGRHQDREVDIAVASIDLAGAELALSR